MRIAIRVDSGNAIGAGHLVRCLTLGDALRDRGADIHFVTRSHPGHLTDLVRARGYVAHELARSTAPTTDPTTWLGATQSGDAGDTRRVTADFQPLDWTIVDHYALDATWHRAMRPATRKLMAIDDLASRPLAADVVLDHNFDAAARDYRALAPSANLLLGPMYCLLPATTRAAGTDVHRIAKPIEQSTVLVSLGASDPANATTDVLMAVHDILSTVRHVDVVIGRAHPDPGAVAAQCRTLSNATLHVQTDRMADLLRTADVAIGAGGTSTWERLHLGVPSIVLPLADNQVPTLQALVDAGLVLSPGSGWRSCRTLSHQLSSLLRDAEYREHLAKRGRHIIDGQGADRVADVLLAEEPNA